MNRLALISLGCPKNLVDSGNLVKKLRAAGFSHVERPEDADLVLVNTCGFIESAKRESIAEVLGLTAVAGKKQRRKLVVFGCLAQRYREELEKEIPEIDAVFGVGAEAEIVEYCRSLLKRTPRARDAGLRRVSAAPVGAAPYEYLKISEGCDRGCSYCVIPSIRGAYRSREPEEIIREAGMAVKAGKRELILIGQDITEYGRDLQGEDLASLVRRIAGIDGDFRIRLLYLYPTAVSDALIETIRDVDKVCRYIDMPLQHSEDRILKLMKRGGSRAFYERLIRKIRTRIPGVTLRTTMIVGFPQETDEDFDGLLAFVKKMRFDRLGAFLYSREKGSEAYGLKGTVPMAVRRRRYHLLMAAQAGISLEKNKSLVGKTFRALVDDVDGLGAVARLESQAPEIDGVTILNEPGLRKGEFVRVRITGAYDYDLMAERVP
ncbi:MAG: 30S ribosomal protein S12 methylthiotransferase RimO [Thermodesulfovibrionales bacterium]